MTDPLTAPLPDHVRVAVIGSGFSGLGMAVRLRQEGVTDFVLLERADALGGTWRDNTYPGAACDVPSHLYSFSFAPNPDWSHVFSRQAEIRAYMERTADEHDLRRHLRCRAEVLEARWDDEARRWAITTSRGTLTADLLVAGSGPLADPKLPDVPGLDRFQGASFHSARWDHDLDLTGKRVAVIGTGASAIQFVPQIQPQVGRLVLFQRTPPWITPRRDRELTDLEKRLFVRAPAAQKAWRSGIYWLREFNLLAFTGKGRLRALGEQEARKHLARQVPDPALRDKLTPNYRMGCKRVLLSNDYYPALTQPNVEVVAAGVREVKEHTLVDAHGVEHEIDVVIFATGFQVTDIPIAHRLRGRQGELLSEHWKGTPQAHKGTTVAGFPNLFLLVGPNTGLGHSSIIFMIESQVAYVLDALRALDRYGADVLEVRPDAQEAYNEGIQQQLQSTVWVQGGCQSWYMDANGRNSTLWPTHTYTFRRETARFDAESYELRAAAAV